MATPLDITALEHFKGVFPFLLVLVFVYAVLSRIAWFKDNKGIAGVIAVLAALITLVSPIAIKTINRMAPWFVLFIMFGVLLILAYMSFGVEESTIKTVLTSDHYGSVFSTWVLAIMLIIALGSLFSVINEEAPLTELSGDQQPAQPGFWETLFHPKLLGMVLVLLVAFFTIGKMSVSEG